MHTVLNDRLDIEAPLLLAPMGQVSGGALAAAVSRAGGLGLIGAGYGDADWLAREFDDARGQRVGVGLITWALARQPSLLDQALAYKPAAVMFSFGDWTPYQAAVRRAGATIICQVQTVAQARAAAAAGADVIVAQGTEGGGHGGARATFTLVPAVVDAVALIGTRFFASEEALGHANAKRFIVDSHGDDTLRTRVFDIVRGYPKGLLPFRARRSHETATGPWTIPGGRRRMRRSTKSRATRPTISPRTRKAR